MSWRTSRRDFLGRVALVGSALSVAPLRYLLRPESAWAVIRPGKCPPKSRCADGWTEFCCSINHGRNSCPSWSYIAGWWKCTYYPGSKLCGEQNVRYYVDCNVKPGHHAPDGCHCAKGTCDKRRVACNVFRYGQCNTHIGEVTEVVCRVVVCKHPSTIPDLNCNSTYKQDNRTCAHEAPCLTAAGAGQEFSW